MKTKCVKNEFVWDFMRPEVATIDSEALLGEAMQEMGELDVHHLVVLNEGKVVGLLEARDLARKSTLHAKVRDVMRVPIPLVDEEMDLSKALAVMLDYRLTALPLVRKGKLSGIVTETDLLRLLQICLDKNRGRDRILACADAWLSKPLLSTLVEVLGNAGI